MELNLSSKKLGPAHSERSLELHLAEQHTDPEEGADIRL